MIVAALAWAAGGCGAYSPEAAGTAPGTTESSPAAKDPDGGGDELTKTVVLDWTGGHSGTTSQWLGETDFARLRLPGGQALAAEAEAFQESVRLRVEAVLGDIGPARFEVVTGEAEDYPEDTVVYFTTDAVEGDGWQVGQTRLDRCDLRPGGEVIVWGGTLLKLGDEHAYGEWVHALANTAAHEVGHTVGFFHPDAVLTDLSEYEKDTEVMLAVHTLSALLGPQRFLIPQETCPDSVAREFGGMAYELATAPTAKRPPVAYKMGGPSEVLTCDFLPKGTWRE